MKKVLFTWALLLCSAASAHTEVTVVSPASGATVRAPTTVTLRFSEPINLRLSTFRVLAVAAGQSATDAAKQALTLPADAARLATTAVVPTGMAATLTLTLKSGLKPGAYVVAWNVLSDDGHPVSGHSLFRVR